MIRLEDRIGSTGGGGGDAGRADAGAKGADLLANLGLFFCLPRPRPDRRSLGMLLLLFSAFRLFASFQSCILFAFFQSCKLKSEQQATKYIDINIVCCSLFIFQV